MTGDPLPTLRLFADMRRYAVSYNGDAAWGSASLHDAALWLTGLADVGNG
jgi:hypothetical protein